MEDNKSHELGKLAEELINYRYTEKLKEKDDLIKTLHDKITELNSEITDIKESKCYFKRTVYEPLLTYSCFNRDEYQSISIDETTKELKTYKKLSDKLRDKYEENKIELIGLRNFKNSSWVTKLLYKMWSKK